MTEDRLRELLRPFVVPPTTEPPFRLSALPDNLYPKLHAYLDLLLRWNARTNLTAIREPEEIVTRHFGESVFTALRLLPHVDSEATLLDVGSGAGFPGLPIQVAIPGLQVTLAESQGKKASFLREAVRVLGLGSEVWSGRVEELPSERRFVFVTVRAVDRMQTVLTFAGERLIPGGVLAELTSPEAPALETLDGIAVIELPGSRRRVLRLSKARLST